MVTMVTSLSLGLPLAVVVASGPVSPVAIAPPLSMVTVMTSLRISVPLSVVAETTIASVAVAETVSTIASVGESVASIAKAKTIGQGIPVASVVGISISLGIGLSSSSGLGLGLPLAVVSSGPVSTLVTSAMAVV